MSRGDYDVNVSYLKYISAETAENRWKQLVMENISNTIKKAVGIVPSPDDTNRIIHLACQVMPYGYGKKGSISLAARLALGTPENHFEIDENQTYGEVHLILVVLR